MLFQELFKKNNYEEEWGVGGFTVELAKQVLL